MVDNASTDDTEKVLEDYAGRPTVSIERLSENTGGAGGFSRGMSLAYERGADFVWIMDDDCYADPTALGELLDGHAAAEKSMGMRLPYACSVVRWTDGDICEMNSPEPTWDWGKLLVRGESSVLVNSCSFVSVLFPRWVMAEHGLPLAEYFIWFDDQEYTRRLTAAGFLAFERRLLRVAGRWLRWTHAYALAAAPPPRSGFAAEPFEVNKRLKEKPRGARALPPIPDPGRDLLAARRAAMETQWRAELPSPSG